MRRPIRINEPIFLGDFYNVLLLFMIITNVLDSINIITNLQVQHIHQNHFQQQEEKRMMIESTYMIIKSFIFKKYMIITLVASTATSVGDILSGALLAIRVTTNYT